METAKFEPTRADLRLADKVALGNFLGWLQSRSTL